MPLDNESLGDYDTNSSEDEEYTYQEEVDHIFGVNQVMENNDISVILTRDELEPEYLPVDTTNVIKGSLHENFINNDCDNMDNESLDVDDVDCHISSHGYTSTK